MLTFAYHRVSTSEQTTDNQALEIESAGFQPDQVYAETISGKVAAAGRPEFRSMLDAIRRTTTKKRLVVTKLDRLGRNAADVLGTVEQLSDFGCAVKVLQLGDMDLTQGAGKIVLATLAAVAEIERDMIVDRTRAGLARARAAGVKVGRPSVVSKNKLADIKTDLGAGLNVSAAARKHGVSRATVWRIDNDTYKGA